MPININKGKNQRKHCHYEENFSQRTHVRFYSFTTLFLVTNFQRFQYLELCLVNNFALKYNSLPNLNHSPCWRNISGKFLNLFVGSGFVEIKICGDVFFGRNISKPCFLLLVYFSLFLNNLANFVVGSFFRIQLV